MNFDDTRREGHEHQIQHAIGQYLKEADELDIAPMVGNFVVLCEVIDETGVVQLASIKADSLPLWTQVGMLTLQIEGLRTNYAGLVMGQMIEDQGDEGYGSEGF